MEVLKYPHPILKTKCADVRRVDAELLALIEEMFQTMYRTKGVGLAANQVGLPLRLFVINPTGDPEKKEQEQVFMNPVITLGSGKPLVGEEGCLSYPGLYADVLRSPKVTLRAYDQHGNEIRQTFEGYLARIVQHESDHLDGIGFVQRVEEDETGEIFSTMKKQEEEFAAKRAAGEIPSDEEIAKHTDALRAKWA